MIANDLNGTQRTLSAEQTREFYHDEFVKEQVTAFVGLLGPAMRENELVVDVGGGCGFFASALRRQTGLATRVLDADAHSADSCRATGIDAQLGDALRPEIVGDESIASLNMVLHHLVGATDEQTRMLQVAALRAWQAQVGFVFVNEYVYESFLSPGLSGKLIWAVTSSRGLSAVAQLASRFVESLQANTLGVGVAFVRLLNGRAYSPMRASKWSRTSKGRKIRSRCPGACC